MSSTVQNALTAAALLGAAAAVVLTAQGSSVGALVATLLGGVALALRVTLARARWGVAVTSVGCMASNAYLLSRKFAAAGTPSICNVNATFNCDVINSSEYSMALGAPITLFGLAFYAGLLVAALTTNDRDRRFFQTTALFAVVTLAYSVFLAAVSASIGAVCLLCLSIYAGNVVLLFAGLRGLRQLEGRLLDDPLGVPVSQSFLTTSGVFVLTVLFGFSAWQGRSSPTPLVEGPDGTVSPYAQLYAQPRGQVTLDGSEPVLGDPSAPYTVVEFADYLCPHCAHASGEIKDLVANNPAIQVHFKAYPLSGTCNPAVQNDDGGVRCLLAAAADCARHQGKFWEMSRAMFDKLGFEDMDDLTATARAQGLDIPTWEACLADPATAEGIGEDVRAGLTAGVYGTPSLFLKGTHGDEWVAITHTVRDLLALVEAHQDGAQLPPPRPQPLER